MATNHALTSDENPNSSQLLATDQTNLDQTHNFGAQISGDTVTPNSLAETSDQDPKVNSYSKIDPRLPIVGMVFYSEEEAYNFYNSYARKRGFSVRKGHLSKRKDGSVQCRHYICSNEGKRQLHPTHITKKPRPLERTNCLARIEFTVNRENIWVVRRFSDEHNHPMASPNKACLLRSHRKKVQKERPVFAESDLYHGVRPDTAKEHEDMAETGTGTGTAMVSGTNCLRKKRVRDLEKGDTQLILDFLKKKQIEEPKFFYAVQLDEGERFTNCFWADAKSVADYTHFGDAVCFETSYHSSMYDLPVAMFIGMNNHKQIIVFGGALLLDETIESFLWLFKTFLAVMSGKQPETIFTNFSVAVSEAISAVFPMATHRICLWHVVNIACMHGQAQTFGQESSFRKEFENLIYGSEFETESGFCKGWDNVMMKYSLNGNSWFSDVLNVRQKWAPPYQCSSFAGIMASKDWYMIMGNLFKRHFYRKLPLGKFMVQYFKSITELREKEWLEDLETLRTRPVPLVDIPMLAEVADSYTQTVYIDFEHEYKSQLACICETLTVNGSMYTYRVSVPQKPYMGIVEFEPSEVKVSCSCKKFESMGILCMHALKVLNNNNILYLPGQYILKRWSKYAKDESENDALAVRGSENGRVWRKLVELMVKSSFCKEILGIVENGLDKFIGQMESLAQGLDTDEVNIGENLHSNPLDSNNISFEGFEFYTR
ncbi:FAR1-related sequence 3 [Rhynchospora pubera]|uniref:FAR1-related sequence 3 n=1 Tax=Rhynchospora pubera TaxID=906938 RepID=A0AAV8DHG0_9POAL|nr:FAR1-related sequence 3 [Rhynchospora pubera]